MFHVFHHYGKYCTIVFRSKNKEDCLERCKLLNIEERIDNPGSNHYYTTDCEKEYAGVDL